jgi:hypothetical protein
MIRKTALLAALAFAIPAYAVDGASLEVGRGDQTDQVRLGVQWKWEKSWSAGRKWWLGAYWDLQAGRWTGSGEPIWDFGITPVFRFERRDPGAFTPYVEAAIGFHLLSDLHVNSNRRFSTHFQYGDHIGAGMVFGSRYQHDLSLRLQHLSNGGISHPNPGINFLQVRLTYWFDPL